MSINDFRENAEIFGYVLFSDVIGLYETAKTSSKEIRQTAVENYLNTLDKIDYSELTPENTYQAVVMTTKVSTWAKRGGMRKQAINKTENLFTLLSDKHEYTEKLKDCAETMIRNNKPSTVKFFTDYNEGKKLPVTGESLKLKNLSP